MNQAHPQYNITTNQTTAIHRTYNIMARRAYSVIMSAALFYTLVVKLFHSCRCDLIREYPGWVVADVVFLLGLEVILAIVCFLAPRRWVIRSVIIIAAVVCTWSVMNAGWLISQFGHHGFLSEM